MFRVSAFLAAILVSGAAQANCQWVDRPTADRAMSILGEAPSVILGDRIEPEAAPRIGIVAAPSYTEAWTGAPFFGLVADGGHEIDIELVYIRSASGAYVNLGRQVGCAGDSAPVRLPSLPPVVDADRAGMALPEISGDRIIGLVDLPGLSWHISAADRRPVALYTAPSLSAPVRATIREWLDLPHDEMGYEEAAALVLERKDGWYRIGVIAGPLPTGHGDGHWALGWYETTPGATAWVAPADAGEFRPYEDLIEDALTYLGDRWDGLLAADPDPAAGVKRIAPQWYREFFRPEEIVVVVRETRWVADRLWARVAVQWPGECEGFRPLPIAEGWVPAYTAAGQPVVRYYSRGC